MRVSRLHGTAAFALAAVVSLTASRHAALADESTSPQRMFIGPGVWEMRDSVHLPAT